ncbi:MAG: hypothetical protein JW944_00950 [Deltaproteobacteria bacterium]|nr:hypothetical protein [Deltaproteobacteria bacterium]
MYILIGLVPVLLGIYGRVAMPENSREAILIDLALKYLSPFFIAVFLGALLAAIMSSADSALLAPSSIIGHNILPYFKPSATEKEKLRLCRWSVPVLGVVSLMMALYFQNIYELCQEAWGILLTGVAAPMFFGVYWKRTTSAGALTGAIAGIVCWVVVKVFFEDYPSNLIGFICSCCFIVLASLATGAAGERAQSAA